MQGRRVARHHQLLLAALLLAAWAHHAGSAAAHQRCQQAAWHDGGTLGSCAAGDAGGTAHAAPFVCAVPSLQFWHTSSNSSSRTSSSSSSSSSSAAQAQARPSPAQQAGGGVDEAGDGMDAQRPQVYIVRFTEYRMLPEMHALIAQALAGVQQHWSWVERANRAVQMYPSDFALLSLSAQHMGSVQQRLRVIPGFRDVHADRRIRGSTKWRPEGPLAAAFSDAAGVLQGRHHPAAPMLRQQPAALRLLREPRFKGSTAAGAAGAGLAMPSRLLLADQTPGSASSSSQPSPGAASSSSPVQPPVPGPVQPPQQEQQPQQEQASPEADADGDAGDIWRVSKPPGRLQTRPTIGLDPASKADRAGGFNKDELRRRHRAVARRRRGLLAWAADTWQQCTQGSWQQCTLGQQPQGQGQALQEGAPPPAAQSKYTFTSTPHPAAGAQQPQPRAGAQQPQQKQYSFTSVPQSQAATQRRRLQANGGGDTRVTTLLEAAKLWKQGFSGKGIKVGVFDTGIREHHPHIRNIKERTNWTHQNSLADGLGHGSFVAGVIGSQDATCPGFAPDMELHTFKVFTDDQVSYTSWFMDAFNYAIQSRLHIINLSIGGPDFLDAPFVDKVLEVTSNGLIMISAIGNDGPLYGTLNNPADQPDVIGVGGIDNEDAVAPFSSRGMTTWELPAGTGRIKPDVMAYGKDVTGSKITSGCRSLSGTSVASPVVAGAATLLASTLPEERRWLLNPASMKQALVEGAVRLPEPPMYEQGAGRINLPRSQAVLAAYSPRASLIPPAIDLTDCPYFWPYCTQPLYAFGLPVGLNATVVNGMGVTGRLAGAPTYTPSGAAGGLLHVSFAHSEVLWPWSGFLAVYVEVSPAAWNFSGVVGGNISFTVESPPQYGTRQVQRSTVTVPLTARIMPTPPRERRVLWDVLHSIKYPPGYVPRDNLDIKPEEAAGRAPAAPPRGDMAETGQSDVLDWHGDHPFTNFHDALNALRVAGYYVEVMHSPATCFDARNYGAYLVVDPEEEWYPEEVAALSSAVKEHGLVLLVLGEWYHQDSLRQMRFFDDNTRSWWTPITGGANVPALNELLAPHNVSLGEAILQGVVTLGDHQVTISYGANIATFPAGGFLHVSTINDASVKGSAAPGEFAAFGVARSGRGKVAVLGDTNCLDSSHMVSPCFDFLKDLLDELLPPMRQYDVAHYSEHKLMAADKALKAPYTAPGYKGPAQRRPEVNFTQYSYVLSHPLACGLPAPCAFRSDAGAGAGCPVRDKAWAVHRALVKGREPPASLLQDVLAAGAAPAAATLPAAAAGGAVPTDAARTVQDEQQAASAGAAAGAAAAGAALAQHDGQQQQLQQPQGGGGGGGTAHPEDSKSGRDEAAQQRQRKAFSGQAASWATLICLAGVVGVVVLWHKRGGANPLGAVARKWGPRRYELVPQRLPPSPMVPVTTSNGERLV